MKISGITKYFCKTAKINFFSLFARIKEAKERAAYHTAPNFRDRFFFDNQGQIKSLAKRNLSRAAFNQKRAKPTAQCNT
ncbi:MAG: hypothetical protein Q8M08_14150 [Bacteroidales bacterium]|nr:hypothetical protein [Bacteroidales bacterium]